MKLLIIRPQPGADATAHRLRAAGHDPIVVPLFTIQHLSVQAFSTEGYDAVLLTSGNAARAAFDFLDGNRRLPIYAVGSATASALQKLSLSAAKTGSEGVDALVRATASDGHKRLLWLAGEDHSPVPRIEGVGIEVQTVYRSATLDLPQSFAKSVKQSDAVILHSSRAAAHFAELCETLELPRAEITLATFSAAIARSAGQNWAATIVADAPNDAALLQAIQGHFKMAHCAS